MFDKIKLISLFFLTVFLTEAYSQDLFINEFMARNKSHIADGFGEYEDWLELYNNSLEAIDIGGMFITDDLENPTKHQIPTGKSKWTNIPEQGHLLLWVDGDDEQGTRHLSLKIDYHGGVLAIFNKDTNLVDLIRYTRQKENMSYGRQFNGTSQMCYFSSPTPDSSNANGLMVLDSTIVPVFSLSAGLYKVPVTLDLSCSSIGDIYYSTDGSEPNLKDGIIYKNPINIDSTVVIRARIFKEGFSKGLVVTKSYFINEHSSIPIVSLTCNPKSLWDKSIGIYRKSEKRGWERKANIEYFDLDTLNEFFLAFVNNVTIRIAGKTSRRQPKKSFAISTNYKYGNPRINYQVFKDKPIDSFGSLWVRADATSGRNVSELWVGERFKNELLYDVNKEMKSTVDMQAYQPVLLFLNGKYWGLYNLMERKGKDFIKNNHGYNDVDILTGEYNRVVRGSSKEWDKLMNLIGVNDIKDDSVLNEVSKLMNIENYIDFWIYEIYSSTHDSRVNIRYWRAKGNNQKWNWISYDQDSWNRYDENSLKRCSSGSEVFIFSRLMKNKNFKQKFANRMCDYLNSALLSDNVIRLVDQITNRISLEVDREKNRWQDSMLYVPANYRTDWIKEYAINRPQFIRNHLIEVLHLNDGEQVVLVDVNNDGGSIQVNSLEIDEFPWSGTYLKDLSIRIEAKSKPGYKFSGWKGRRLSDNPILYVNPRDCKKMTAIFKKSSQPLALQQK